MFKKIADFFKKLASGLVADAVIAQSGEMIQQGLEAFYAEKPKTCASLVSSFYIWIPTLQGLAAKTKTPLDDKEVVELKSEIEAFAAKHGIQLVDLDKMPQEPPPPPVETPAE